MKTSIRFPKLAILPEAPRNGSPVPGLTSLYHKLDRGPYGNAGYPGNCSGALIKDLLNYFQPRRVADPMTGSGTCRDVCRELGIPCRSSDIADGVDACDSRTLVGDGPVDFIWLHPPYWRMKRYTDDARDLSNCRTLDAFLKRLHLLLLNCEAVLAPGGHLAVLMGDYTDRDAGFVPLTYHVKRLAFAIGFKQNCTDIIRFSHGASSAKKSYKSVFIPSLHDVVIIFTKRA